MTAILVAITLAHADFVTDTIPTGTNPYSVAVNPITNRTYVANYGSGTVTVINGSTSDIAATITVGSNPRAIAVNALTNKIYVANFTASSVSVIDGATNTVTTTVTVQSMPNAIAVNPSTNKIYITNYGSASVSVINGGSDTLDNTITVGVGPIAVCTNPVTNRIYVANSGSSSVTVINGADNSISTVTAGTTPYSIASNTVTNKIYVTNQGSNNVTIIDGATNGTTNIAAGTSPSAIAVNLVTDTVYVVNSGSNNITMIDGATGTVTTTVTVGTNPTAIAINTTTNKIYVANYGSNCISVFTAAILDTTISAGTNPNAVAVNTITNKIYTVNAGSGNVTVVDGERYTAANAAATAGFSRALGVNFLTNKLYVVHDSGARVKVTVIDGTTHQTTTVDIRSLPYTSYGTELLVNPVTNKIHVNFRWTWISGDHDSSFHIIDGVTNQVVTLDSVPVPSMNRADRVDPVTNKRYGWNDDGFDRIITVEDVVTGAKDTVTKIINRECHFAVNPVTNKGYVAAGSNVMKIDGTPSSDTKLRVFFDDLLAIGFTRSTFLAQPFITGKAVNRLRTAHTGISSVLISKATAQSSWGNASITSGAGTDSISWEWVWGSDTLLFGENLLCAVALDSQTTSTNNPGSGTPFTGNATVYPVYRLPPPPAAAPVPISPLDMSVDQPLSTTFSWNTVSGATSYILQVSSDPLFSTFVFNGMTSTASHTVSSLACNTAYYWRVNARNYSFSGPWSSVWSLSTRAAGIPALSSPANAAVDITTNPLLSWDTASCADSYSIQVSSDSTFPSTVINQSGLAGTSYQASGLSVNTVYYWRANASNGAATGPWSETWSFTTISTPPDSAVLSSPANGAISISTNPTLAWIAAARAGSYIVHVSTASDFSSPVVNDSGITSTTHTIASLSDYTLYYWRIKAVNAVGESGWSVVWNFMTGATVVVPSAPVLLSPANGATDQPVLLTLIWNRDTLAAGYHVQVAIDSVLSSLFADDSTLVDTLVSLGGFDSSGTYYWRVRAKNAGGASAWSEVRSFTTVTSGVLPYQPSLPTAFSIKSYPHQLRYTLPQSCRVSVRYFNLRGRQVASLVNRVQGPGYYTLQIDRTLLSSGVYLRVFEAGNFVRKELTSVVR